MSLYHYYKECKYSSSRIIGWNYCATFSYERLSYKFHNRLFAMMYTIPFKELYEKKATMVVSFLMIDLYRNFLIMWRIEKFTFIYSAHIYNCIVANKLCCLQAIGAQLDWGLSLSQLVCQASSLTWAHLETHTKLYWKLCKTTTKEVFGCHNEQMKVYTKIGHEMEK